MDEERIYLTLLIVSPELDRDALSAVLQQGGEAALRWHLADDINFGAIYRRAYRFYYNDFFVRRLDWSYLGCLHEDLPHGVGSIRIDFVLHDAEPLALRALHIHIAPRDWVPLPAGERERCFKQLAELVRTALYSPGRTDAAIPAGVGRVLAWLRARTENKRSFGLGYSSYAYFSWCTLADARFASHRHEHAVDVYRLLYLHGDNIDAGVAGHCLDAQQYASTDFFRNYFQPGAIVSVSKPHARELYAEHRDWFLPAMRRDEGLWRGDRAVRIERAQRRGDEPYDWTPEYPPLRYMGLLSLEFAGFYEETLRGIHDRLLLMWERSLRHGDRFAANGRGGRVWGASLELIRALLRFPELMRLELRYARVNNFEYLRLPIAREIVDRLIDAKLQRNVADNIAALKTSSLNALLFVLTVIATVATLVSLL